MNISELSTVFIAVCTAIYTFGTFLLWATTKRTVELMQLEIKKQSSLSYSATQHSIINAHRDLYLEIIKNDELLTVFSSGVDLEKEEARKQMLATMLINHTLRIFLDYKNSMMEHISFENFAKDAQDLFSIPFIKNRWEEVKHFHPSSFRTYVDDKLIQ